MSTGKRSTLYQFIVQNETELYSNGTMIGLTQTLIGTAWIYFSLTHHLNFPDYRRWLVQDSYPSLSGIPAAANKRQGQIFCFYAVEPAHQCPCHQGQFYCAAQARCQDSSLPMVLTGAMSGSIALLQSGSMLMSQSLVTTKSHMDISGLYCPLRHCTKLVLPHSCDGV